MTSKSGQKSLGSGFSFTPGPLAWHHCGLWELKARQSGLPLVTQKGSEKAKRLKYFCSPSRFIPLPPDLFLPPAHSQGSPALTDGRGGRSSPVGHMQYYPMLHKPRAGSVERGGFTVGKHFQGADIFPVTYPWLVNTNLTQLVPPLMIPLQYVSS